MKRFFATTFGVSLLLAGAEFAAAQTVTITPQQQTIIREYVTTQPLQPIPPPPDVNIAVGAVLPPTIELHTLQVPQLQTPYEYVVIGGQTVVVDPGTRRILYVLQ